MEEFKVAFLDCFIPLESREVKIQEFINLKQESMSIREYVFKFTKLSQYAPFIIFYPRARMSKFVSSVLDIVSKEYNIAMLIKEMDILRIMTYEEQIKDKKLMERLDSLRGIVLRVVTSPVKGPIIVKMVDFMVGKGFLI